MLLVRRHLTHVVLIGAQKALTITSCRFDSSKTSAESLIGNLVALRIGACVHALIHSVHFVLCQAAGFLWNTTISLSLGSHVLGLIGIVMATAVCDRPVGLLLMVAQRAGSLVIRTIIHLVR